MRSATRKAWRVSTYGDIDRTLDVRVVGRHEQDYAKLSKDEARARRSAFQNMNRRFEHGELVTQEELGGSLWAWRRMNARGDKAPNFMNLGGKPAVNAACKAVLEEADLGAINFHPIRILNAGRKSEPWPEEIYVVNVGNAKMSLAIEDGLRTGNLQEVWVPGFELPPEKMIYNLAGKDIASLTVDALDGPDIWMEPKLSRGNLFISDRLAKFLKAAKMTGGWGLKECPIVGIHQVE